MEIFELRYFLAVARGENVHRAAERLRVSPGALSKAVARIESELGVKLFSREGRNIRLTDHGRLLQSRASRIVELEEAARAEVGSHPGGFHGVIAGPEVLLARFGVELTAELERKHPGVSFELMACGDAEALERVERGEAQLAFVTADVPQGLVSKAWGETEFVTVAGPGHPLHGVARSKKPVAVEKVLEHGFVSPSLPLLGTVGAKQSLDGWRDDRFARRVSHLTASLKCLEELVLGGMALAYLPDYHARKLGLPALKVTGCPYTCGQKIRLVARRPQDVGWINELF